MRDAVGKSGWNKALAGKEQTLEDLKYDNYVKEMFLDSDTKIALISSAPSDIPQRLVPHQRADGRGARQGEQGGRHAPAVRAHDLHARPARLAGAARRRSRAEAGVGQGLHRRRQHAQGDQPLSLAHGRREGRLQGLREDGEGRHQERLRAQGPVLARRREAVPEPARLRRRRRRRAGGEGLAAAQLHHLSRRLSPRRRRSEGRARRVQSHRPHRLDQRPRRHSRRSTASTTSTATSASCSRRRWSPSRTSAPR